MLVKNILLCRITDKTEDVLLIKSGGGTGPVMPGNPLEREGAKSCGTVWFREIGREKKSIPFRTPRKGIFFEEVLR
jgi:hypothetical protein